VSVGEPIAARPFRQTARRQQLFGRKDVIGGRTGEIKINILTA
jgi:hypothetical protein